MQARTISNIAGVSYLAIFFSAIFANFFVIEAIINNPLSTVLHNGLFVRFGILAFLVTVFFDVVIAWALFELFKDNILSRLSTYFRLMHAAIMGVAVFALPFVFQLDTADEILKQVDMFNTIWLIALLFFGFHLILLAKILKKPKWLTVFLALAGMMYIIDTSAHILLENYDAYANVFLLLVAAPSIIGELSLTFWLLLNKK